MSEKYALIFHKVLNYIYIFINKFIIYNKPKLIKKIDENLDPEIEEPEEVEFEGDYRHSYLNSYRSMSTIVMDSSSDDLNSKNSSFCDKISSPISSIKSLFNESSSSGSCKSHSDRKYSPAFDKFEMLKDEFLLINDDDKNSIYRCPSCGINVDKAAKSYFYSDHEICKKCYGLIIDKIKS